MCVIIIIPVIIIIYIVCYIIFVKKDDFVVNYNAKIMDKISKRGRKRKIKREKQEIDKQYKDIMEAIMRSANRGRQRAVIENICEENIKKLEKKGFIVEPFDDYIIKWGEDK